MNDFDPNQVKKYTYRSRGQGEGDSVFVAVRDYNKLLELYKSQAKLLQRFKSVIEKEVL